MADINALADAAIRLRKKYASHIGWPLVIRKAIEASGVTFEPDVKRLAKKVRAELIRRGVIVVRKRGPRRP